MEFDRGMIPVMSTVQFAHLVTVTPYLCDVNALGIAVGASLARTAYVKCLAHPCRPCA